MDLYSKSAFQEEEEEETRKTRAEERRGERGEAKSSRGMMGLVLGWMERFRCSGSPLQLKEIINNEDNLKKSSSTLKVFAFFKQIPRKGFLLYKRRGERRA
ncbi:Hypothetical predicted protein, partial [Scomber scombrus]